MRWTWSLWIFLAFSAPCIESQVRVWQGTMPLAASDEGTPDENPPWQAWAEQENYPYTLRQSVLPTETTHAWRAVFLENEYLKCTILPDVGGHIYTCIDKINGRPMFYANPSLKKALVAYRGAWAAFGVEFNFPVSHNWVTMSPVDFAYSKATDGSASVTVGNRDRVFGMDWTVEIVLRPGSTLVEERVTLSNHSDLRHHFFWWNNGAIQVWDDSRVWYPMQLTLEGQTWPIDAKGVDQSLISNQTAGQVSLFAYGSREPFMGVYNPHTDAGTVHYADHGDVPGQKIWSWGVDKADLEWRHIISDNNSAYVEVQGGRFKDQDTYGYLEPRQAIHFSEFWMPVREIGSISRATLDGIVAMIREPETGGRIALTVGFNANHAEPGAKIEISDGTTSLYKESASLDPAKTWTHRLADLATDKRYTFLLTDAKGGVLLKHTEDSYDVTARNQAPALPSASQPPLQKDWADGTYLGEGAAAELSGNYGGASENYRAGLAKFPANFELLKAAGRLSVAQFRYEEAARDLGLAEERVGTDAEVHYYRGIAETALGRPADALEEFEAAHRDPAFRAAGGLLLAELLAQGGDAKGALKQLQESCPATSGDLRCIEETVALERTTADTDHAKTLVQESLLKFPTSMFLQNELAKVGTPAGDLDRHLAADTSRILNLVIQYDRLGLYADSLELLSRSYPAVAPEESEPAAIRPSNDPQLAYYRGFCKQKMGQSGQADFDAASHMPLLYIFPNEADTFPVLHAAITANPSDAPAHFLLGELLFSKGIVDPALAEWKLAESIEPKTPIPSLDASMGRVLLEIKKRPGEAAAVLERGLLVDTANPALYLELNEAMKQMGRTASQRAEMMLRFPDHIMPADLVRAMVETLREAGRTDEANSILTGHFMPRKEGQQPLQPTAPAR
jgi:tetratricopeptide (TPR) repeat protein